MCHVYMFGEGAACMSRISECAMCICLAGVLFVQTLRMCCLYTFGE